MPETAEADIGVNFYPLSTEREKGGYIRPNNFNKTTDKVITFLHGKICHGVARSIRAGKYLSVAFPKVPTMEKSVKDEDPTEDMMSTYQAKKDRYDAEVKVWSTERKKLMDGKYYAVELIHRQCTSGMREALQQRDEYEKVVEDGDVLGLLELVKTFSLGHRGKGYQVKNAFDDLRRIIDCHQGPREKNGDYRDRMETAILRAEQSGLSLSKAFKFKSQDGEDMSPKDTRD